MMLCLCSRGEGPIRVLAAVGRSWRANAQINNPTVGPSSSGCSCVSVMGTEGRKERGRQGAVRTPRSLPFTPFPRLCSPRFRFLHGSPFNRWFRTDPLRSMFSQERELVRGRHESPLVGFAEEREGLSNG